MARARNIKPGFFENEELVELPYSTRLLFIGLWTICDRAGRLEDRPKRIKMSLFPADNLDIDEALNELQSSGFLVRYEIEGSKFIQVTNFSKHQNPHKDEKASSIPAPYVHSASTVQAPCKHSANPADSPIPDSPIPDSPIPDSPNDESNPLSESIVSGTPKPVDENPPKNETRTGRLCKQLRVIGIDAAPHYQAWPELLSGFSDLEIVSAAQKARDSKPGERIHLNYILPILKDRCPPNARGSPTRAGGRQSRVDNYASEAAAARGDDEIKHSTSRVERDITGESVRVA